MNQRYASSAMVPDDSPAEVWETDRELVDRPTTRPGAKLPHAWLVDAQGERLSTLDAVGHGLLTVLTGLSGGVWRGAAGACADALGVPLRVVRIGDEDHRDAYGEWSRVCEIAEDGVLLVRPDGHIAWRRSSAAESDEAAYEELLGALRHVLAREAPPESDDRVRVDREGAGVPYAGAGTAPPAS
jgi:2,4-dichlorophenol 6-monooxygenase